MIKNLFIRIKQHCFPPKDSSWGFEYWFYNNAPRVLNKLANDIDVHPPVDILMKYQKMFPEIVFEEVFINDNEEDKDKKYFRNWKKIIITLSKLIQNSSLFTYDRKDKRYKNGFELGLKSFRNIIISGNNEKDHEQYEKYIEREGEILKQIATNRERSFTILMNILPDLY